MKEDRRADVIQSSASPLLHEFNHQTLGCVQSKLQHLLDHYSKKELEEFITEAAEFICEGMDYICNVQLPKKSCDVIYQYQYLLRSEVYVNERQQILDKLLPMVTDLKEKKFNMTP